MFHFNLMRICLVNDDGYNATGIQTLIEVLHKEHELFVIAPKRHQSGAGQSISIKIPITIEDYEDPRCKGYIIDGRPADCVNFGLQLAL